MANEEDSELKYKTTEPIDQSSGLNEQKPTEGSETQQQEDCTRSLPNDGTKRDQHIQNNTDSKPNRVGRYPIKRLLGKGGFGEVYLGFDDQLKRDVAIKLTYGSKVGPKAAKMFMEEARILAELDHPNIVPVFDIGNTVAGDVFIVSKFIDGTDLATRIEQDRPSRERSLEIIIEIAEALHYAHTKGLIHRDVKPANILLDKSGRPYLADFGIALRESELVSLGEITGTPAYMSPEQARGEGHLISHQSDIFSLGLVLYELLSGRRPYQGKTTKDMIRLAQVAEVRTPRLFDSTITTEIERVCLKALARRPSERYAIAKDFAEELQFLISINARNENLAQSYSSPNSNRPKQETESTDHNKSSTSNHLSKPTLIEQEKQIESAKIVPRGLRSFDQKDSEFFLELLPGLRDRSGLPESLRFWKDRIEATQIEESFRVGLVYGPSGCGKSSLVKAGLLPRLSPKIEKIYIEATPEDTLARLHKAIQKKVPEAAKYNLVETLSLIRRRKLVPNGGKLLLVIDQFEQWLHAHHEYSNQELADVLRQCDGETVQAILMVRDDFWSSVSEFLEDLDVPMLERENAARVDLFDLDHAEHVLELFGQAYERLPKDRSSWSEQQKQFLQTAVEGLAENRKVISVRLALFAEMMKSREWVPKSIEEVGGVSGVGVRFLEETFGDKYATIQIRKHQQAVRGILSGLLPSTGTDIKGHNRSSTELQKAVGYETKPGEFADLINLLDKNLRLITPSDDSGSANRSYQLTHDYLVPSLREWLNQKQRETKKGRAELRLAERAAAWIGAKKEIKQLPTLVELVQIRRFTESPKWTACEKELLKKAMGVHLKRILMATAAVVLLTCGSWFAWNAAGRNQEAIRIAGLVNTLIDSDPERLVENIEKLNNEFESTESLLRNNISSESSGPDSERRILHSKLALVAKDPSFTEDVTEAYFSRGVSYLLPIRQILTPHADFLTEPMAKRLKDSAEKPEARFRAAIALAEFQKHPSDLDWDQETTKFVAEQLVSANPEFQPIYRKGLRPIKAKLIDSLIRLFTDKSLKETQSLSAAISLADFAGDDQIKIADLLTEATPEQYAILFPLIEKGITADAVSKLKEVASAVPPDELGSVPRIALGQKRANAAVTMLKLGEKESVLPVFNWTDDPEALTQFIFRCKPRGIPVDALLDLLDLVSVDPMRYPKDTRYALLLSIGEYGRSEIPAGRCETLIKKLADWYANDPSSGVHGAAGWLLWHLGEMEVAKGVDQQMKLYSPDREWFTLVITMQPLAEKSVSETTKPKPPKKTFYYTFIVHTKGEFTIGSLDDQPDRLKEELRYTVILTRPFAMLDREITCEELIAFAPPYAGYMKQKDAAPNDAGFAVDWYDSVAFCRWLGQEMGLSETDQCYPDPETLDEKQYPRDPQSTSFPRDWPLDLSKRGFRLPTQSEWEIAARSGSRTTYGFGSEISLLDRFGWFAENSGKKVHPVMAKRPSVRGMFDLHGNTFEWTHDWNENFWYPRQTDPVGAKTGSGRVFRGGGWSHVAALCRSAGRFRFDPSSRSVDLGFRLALSCPSGIPESPEADK